MNLGKTVRWSLAVMVAWTTFAVSFLSSGYTAGIPDITKHFEVSEEIATLGVSFYVLGFAIGPLVWAPLSELYGRQLMFFISYGLLTAFTAGGAGANSIATVLVLRFFAGSFGSSPLSNSGGVIADIFPDSERGLAVCFFSAAPFLGPTLGPILGGFFVTAYGWRWLMGLLTIISGVFWILGTVVVPETYAPYLLRQRAAELSRRTGKCYVSKSEHGKPKVTVGQNLKTALSRPWVLLILEPIVLLLSIYAAVIYGTLYMLFAAYPIVYQEQRGWSQGIGGLPFLSLALGMVFAVVYTVFENNRYQRVQARHNGRAPPETRLVSAIVGGVTVPIGLFWFAWTTSPSIHWMVSIAAGVPFGFGMVLLFLGIMNYLIDAYTMYAASVLAANSIIRSVFGAVFPLFTSYMYKNLGTNWASSVPAFLALACVPFPFIFYKYGPAIRARCKFAAKREENARREASEREQEDGITIEGVLSDTTDVRTTSDDAASVRQQGDQQRMSGATVGQQPHNGNPYNVDMEYSRETLTEDVK